MGYMGVIAQIKMADIESEQHVEQETTEPTGNPEIYDYDPEYNMKEIQYE